MDDPANVRPAARIDHTTSEYRETMPDKSGYNLEHAREGVEIPQRSAEGDLQTSGQPLRAMNGHQIEPKQQYETSEETIVQTGASFQEKAQTDEYTSKFMHESSSQSAPLTAETATSGQDEVSRLATASAANSILTDSSISLLAPSLSLPQDESTSLAVGAEVEATPSAHTLWDGSDPHSPKLRPTSLPLPKLPVLPHTVSSSSRHRRHQSDLSPQHTLGVVSLFSVQGESHASSTRLRAHLSSESLATTSSGSLTSDEEGNESLSTIDSDSVGSTWGGTIIDMECKCAKVKGGHRVYFQAKLDTAARRDVLAERIVNRLGITVRPDCKGRTFGVVGHPLTSIKPLGYVMLNLRGVGRERRLKLKFYVLADRDVGNSFDCLLGCATSRKHFLALREEWQRLTEDLCNE